MFAKSSASTPPRRGTRPRNDDTRGHPRTPNRSETGRCVAPDARGTDITIAAVLWRAVLPCRRRDRRVLVRNLRETRQKSQYGCYVKLARARDRRKASFACCLRDRDAARRSGAPSRLCRSGCKPLTAAKGHTDLVDQWALGFPVNASLAKRTILPLVQNCQRRSAKPSRRADHITGLGDHVRPESVITLHRIE